MIEFSGYKWRTQQPWGDFHPNNPIWWYDPSCVDVTDNVLRLQTKYHTRETFKNKIGVGLVSSENPFTYGEFMEIKAELDAITVRIPDNKMGFIWSNYNKIRGVRT
jgi:hypothetical protein